MTGGKRRETSRDNTIIRRAIIHESRMMDLSSARVIAVPTSKDYAEDDDAGCILEIRVKKRGREEKWRKT